jgi:hypothetical protein
MKIRIIDEKGALVYAGEHNCVHCAAEAQAEGIEICWIMHNRIGLEIGVYGPLTVLTIDVDGDLWIGKGVFSRGAPVWKNTPKEKEGTR